MTNNININIDLKRSLIYNRIKDLFIKHVGVDLYERNMDET